MQCSGIAVFIDVENAVNLQSLRLEYGRDAIPPTLPD